MAPETEEMRSNRHHRRTLFDGVAGRYEAFRRGYPPEIVSFTLQTAGLGTGSSVLEVGCGTGQLTSHLSGCGFTLTAIDIGAGMVSAARQRTGQHAARFEAVPFEEFEPPAASFDLIISATAFHWVDPEVKFTKAARLLKPGGWLALLGTAERYDDPFGAALRDMWVARSGGPAGWASQDPHPETDLSGAAGLFGPPAERAHAQRIVLPAQSVLGVETTRSTFLHWPAHTQRSFISELRSQLRSQTEVHLTQETWLAMAPVLPRP